MRRTNYVSQLQKIKNTDNFDYSSSSSSDNDALMEKKNKSKTDNEKRIILILQKF